MRSSRLLSMLFVALYTTLASPDAWAMTVQKASVERLADVASEIHLAEVSAKHAFWRDGRIVTRYTLRSRDVLKGRRGAPLQVELLGGVVGEIGQRVHGIDHFDVGDTAVFFLGRSKQGAWVPVGQWQGMFRTALQAPLGAEGFEALGTTPIRLLHPVDRAPEDRLPTYSALRTRVRQRLGGVPHE